MRLCSALKGATLLAGVAAAHAAPTASPAQLEVHFALSSPHYPVVLTGAELEALRGLPIGRIALLAVHGGIARRIAFQIDPRDAAGAFQLDAGPEARLDENDECVFLAGDAGERADAAVLARDGDVALEIALADPSGGRRAWVYVQVTDHLLAAQEHSQVRYDAALDRVDTMTYRLGFSARAPMLIDSIRWSDPATGWLSPELLDCMKIRHTGRFLHHEFRRTEEDYDSHLLGVRVGPVRVIRSTANRVRLFLGLRSPSVHIDYIAYANCYVAEIRLRVPFRLGWLFSDLLTTTTLDQNDDADLPQVTVYTLDAADPGAVVDGHQTSAERRFNAARVDRFLVSGRLGVLMVGLEVEPQLALRGYAWMMDARERADPPERRPGQFGNIGFAFTGWEALDTAEHRLEYWVYLTRDVSLQHARRALQDAPSLLR